MTRQQFDDWKRYQRILDGTEPCEDAVKPEQQQVNAQTPQQHQQAGDSDVAFMMSLPASEIAKLPEAMRDRFRKATFEAYARWQRGG